MRPDSSAVSHVTLPRTHYTEAHYGIRVILLGFGSVAVSIHLSVVTVAIVCHCQVIVRGGESGGVRTMRSPDHMVLYQLDVVNDSVGPVPGSSSQHGALLLFV